MRDLVTTTVDGAAAFERLHHSDDFDDERPTLADEANPGSFGATGPGPHTHDSDPRLTCFRCLSEASR